MATKYYCKYCGYDASALSTLKNGSCSKNPNGKYHELYEGGEKSKYYCKYCSNWQTSIYRLTNGSCSQNPNGKYHEPM